MEADEFHVGQVVFVVYNKNRSGGGTCELSVTKIGRKWVTIGAGWREERFDPRTMMLDGKEYDSHGKVWLYKEEWERDSVDGKAWDEFRRNIPYARPHGVNAEAVATIKRILGMP